MEKLNLFSVWPLNSRKRRIGYLIGILGIIGLSIFLFCIFGAESASDFGGFFGGLVGTLFSIISVLFIVITLIYQIKENNKNAVVNQFFKMLDYHRDNVSELKASHIDCSKEEDVSEGRRSFIIFKSQLSTLLNITSNIIKKLNLKLDDKDIIDIAYTAFYYGIDDAKRKNLEDKLKCYPEANQIVLQLLEAKNKNEKIGITNQTGLSAYFRNMYNAIKLIDESGDLTDDEKQRYVKILRAQLANPELYILYFNVMSRFGEKSKWRNKKGTDGSVEEEGYIMKYKFLRNLPLGDCDGYDPREDFPMVYEEDEHIRGL